MLTLRKGQDRGHFKNDWLDSYHTFSFGDYYDTRQMGFHDLRVINQDVVKPGNGFPTHAHRDMEIITYVLRGVVEHQDSMGHKKQIKAGEFQMMSAGTGVTHSEVNPDSKTPLELLQIWILPKIKGVAPAYKQVLVANEDKLNSFMLVAGPKGDDAPLTINQDARLFVGTFEKNIQKRYEPKEGHSVWIQAVKGDLIVNKQPVKAGDGLAIENEPLLRVESSTPIAEFLLFDLK